MTEQQLLPLQQRRLRESAELAATQETCKLQAQWIDALQDPEVVLVGMLRGSIAKLSVRSFVKTHGEVINTEEAQLLEIAKLREQVVLLRDRKNSIAHLLHQLAAVQLTCDTLQNQLGQWKANHADVVARNRILRDRPDLPADRIPAVEQLEVLQNENRELRLQCGGMQMDLDELRAGAASSGAEDRRPE